MFINPGGPGGSGTLFSLLFGRALQTVVGGDYDILGFDPRGTGASTPRAECFGSDTERMTWLMQAGGGRLLNVSDDSLLMYRAREQVMGARCEEKIGGEGGIARFAGTPSVATDMVEIAKKLGQEKVNYWGFVSLVFP